MIPEWLQRVVDEKAELDGRLVRLKTFMEGDQFQNELSSMDQHLLRTQFELMSTVSFILELRIGDGKRLYDV